MRQSFTLQRGKISVAAMPSFAANVLPEALKAFRDRYAGVNVTVHDVINEQVIEMVREGGWRWASLSSHRPTTTCCLPRWRWTASWRLFPNNPRWRRKSSSPAGAVDPRLYYPAAPLGGTPDAGGGAGAQRTSAGRGAGESSAGDGGEDGGQRHGGSAVPALCKTQMASLGAVCIPLSDPPIEKCVGAIHAGHLPLSKAAQALLDTLKGFLPT